MNLTFDYSEKEYAAAARYFYDQTARFRPTRVVWVSGIVVLVCSVALWLSRDFSFFTLLFCNLAVLAFALLDYYVSPRKYLSNRKWRDTQNLTFNDDGVQFCVKNTDSQRSWNLYKGVWETSEFYFLHYGKDMYTLIPKRVFENKEQEYMFRRIVRQKVDPRLDRSFENSLLEEEYIPTSLEPPEWR